MQNHRSATASQAAILRHRREQAKRHRGFTLIELLVVIAIIAILAAILFPVYQRVKQRATLARCLSNAKQIAFAIRQYADDNDGYYPTAWLPGNGPNPICGIPGTSWMEAIQPYISKAGVFSHMGGAGYETVCSGIVIPKEGSLIALNNVVHGRIKFNPGWIPPNDWKEQAAAFWPSRVTKDGQPGTFPGWQPSLNEADVHFPSLLVSMCEQQRAIGLQPSQFIYRGRFHRTWGGRLNGCPFGNVKHGRAAVVAYLDGHVDAYRISTQGGPIGNPQLWNNSPYNDAGGWNRNRSDDSNDDVYHGVNEARPPGAYTGCFPIDQLDLDVSLGGSANILNDFYISHMYGRYESIFDEDMTFGEYNTEARPDAKYDE